MMFISQFIFQIFKNYFIIVINLFRFSLSDHFLNTIPRSEIAVVHMCSGNSRSLLHWSVKIAMDGERSAVKGSLDQLLAHVHMDRSQKLYA